MLLWRRSYFPRARRKAGRHVGKLDTMCFYSSHLSLPAASYLEAIPSEDHVQFSPDTNHMNAIISLLTSESKDIMFNGIVEMVAKVPDSLVANAFGHLHKVSMNSKRIMIVKAFMVRFLDMRDCKSAVRLVSMIKELSTSNLLEYQDSLFEMIQICVAKDCPAIAVDLFMHLRNQGVKMRLETYNILLRSLYDEPDPTQFLDVYKVLKTDGVGWNNYTSFTMLLWKLRHGEPKVTGEHLQEFANDCQSRPTALLHADQPFVNSKDHLPTTIVGFNYLISRLAKEDRFDDALSIFRLIERSPSLAPNDATFACLARAASSEQQIIKVSLLRSSSSLPMSATYFASFLARPASAKTLDLEAFLGALKNAGILFNLALCRALISYLDVCNQGSRLGLLLTRIPDATSRELLLHTLKALRPGFLTEDVYNLLRLNLSHALSRVLVMGLEDSLQKSDYKEAYTIAASLISSGHNISSTSLRMLIKALIQTNSGLSMAEKLTRKALDVGIIADSTVFRILIKNLSVTGQAASARSLLSAIHSKGMPCQGAVASGIAILYGIRAAEKYLDQLINESRASPSAFQGLICESISQSNLSKATELLERAKKANLAEQSTFLPFLELFCEQNNAQDAHRTIRDMIRLGVANPAIERLLSSWMPRSLSLGRLSDGALSDSLSIINPLLKLSRTIADYEHLHSMVFPRLAVPDRKTARARLYVLMRDGAIEKALEFLSTTSELGTHTSLYNKLLQISVEKNDVSGSRLVIVTMSQYDIIPDPQTMALQAELLVKRGYYSEAAALFGLMQKMGMSPNAHFFGVMLKASAAYEVAESLRWVRLAKDYSVSIRAVDVEAFFEKLNDVADMKEFQEVASKLGESGIMPGSIVASKLLAHSIKRKNLAEAQIHCRKLLSLGVTPEPSATKEMIWLLLSHGKFDDAHRLFTATALSGKSTFLSFLEILESMVPSLQAEQSGFLANIEPPTRFHEIQDDLLNLAIRLDATLSTNWCNKCLRLAVTVGQFGRAEKLLIYMHSRNILPDPLLAQKVVGTWNRRIQR